jgi:hypothetical protein
VAQVTFATATVKVYVAHRWGNGDAKPIQLHRMRCTLGQIIDQYWDLSKDDRTEVTMQEIVDWFSEQGWIWKEEL